MKKLAFTMADRLSRFYTLVPSRFAFTMAEILLSLTIIGVVAAITLPSLMGNINERTWNTQRKALYSRMSQAIAMMPSLNTYKEVWGIIEEEGTKPDEWQEGLITEGVDLFLTNGLSKVLKINNICDKDHLADCGLSSTVYNMSGGIAYSKFPEIIEDFAPNWVGGNTFNKPPAAFETQNGESVLVFFNPYCINKIEATSFVADNLVCANFVYDLNGNKGPNTMGKDIGFMTALYATDPELVAPMPLASVVTTNDINATGSACRNADENSRVASFEESLSLVINGKLVRGNKDFVVTNKTDGPYGGKHLFIEAGSYISDNKILGAGGSIYVYPDLTEGSEFAVDCVKR